MCKLAILSFLLVGLISEVTVAHATGEITITRGKFLSEPCRLDKQGSTYCGTLAEQECANDLKDTLGGHWSPMTFTAEIRDKTGTYYLASVTCAQR
jgi:hypothetical protein